MWDIERQEYKLQNEASSENGPLAQRKPQYMAVIQCISSLLNINEDGSERAIISALIIGY